MYIYGITFAKALTINQLHHCNSIFMKKLFLLALTTVIFFGSISAFAQRRTSSSVVSSDVQNLVKLNPLSLFTKTASVSYERVLSDNLSLQLGVQYTLPRKARILGVDLLGENGEMNRFSITPELRYFPSGHAPTGFYLAPFVRYANFSAKGDITKDITGDGTAETFSGKITQSTYSLGGVIGGQWLFGEHVSLEAYIGPYLSLGNLKVSQNLSEDDYNVPASLNFPVWIRSGITIGYAF